eukprot:TRINITY_DN4043_c0_g1::TRINITY_DN4043_c0_g1_i1::g.11884::m.11884 TRINITY_DN4043_c0_g1::TRINITY_DN4043_c0_g1_i1::g.11884  ORF type:complete len:791 (+),score=192.32,sp/Q7Z402/TMC7_HUMAN/20.04/3e-11,TMC/PF07810.8/1.5e-08,IncA/PF04156.9/0.00071,IncA/PF04156.9/1.4e+03,IncA/PF04156.9/7.6e+02,Tropomyosin_1/PF12718.2/0.0018,Tropomyosin_1/PF12718.2/7e+03,Tropomyosin_1/PF12718.2/4.4e+03,Phage_GP20/PF06810.6/0.21,Phage_GP20/PF06810.6/12,BRE1/PF08647.6/0.48,BRE1/PF08647.6/6,GAS/PF13851.1/0.038,APG6/PF04111.
MPQGVYGAKIPRENPYGHPDSIDARSAFAHAHGQANARANGGGGGGNMGDMSPQSVTENDFMDRAGNVDKVAAFSKPGDLTRQDIDKLKERFTEAKEKFTNVKKEKRDLTEENRNLKQKVEDLEFEKEDIQSELEEVRLQLQEREAMPNQLAGLMPGVLNLALMGKNNNKRRSVDNDIRAQIQAGEAAALDEDDDDVVGGGVRQTSHQLWKVWRVVRNYLKKYGPLQSELRYIDARYGGGIAAYFRFYAWLCGNSAMVALVYLLLLIPHTFSESMTDLSGILPITWLYSYYDEDNRVLFTVCLVLWMVLNVMSSAYLLSKDAARTSIEKELTGGNAQFKFAPIALNIWDYSVSEAGEVEDLQNAVVAALRMRIAEENAQEQRESRTKEEWRMLYIRRASGIFLTLVFIGSGSYLVIVVMAQQSEMKSWLQGNVSVSSTYTDYVPTIAVSLIGALMPKVVLKASEFERWDDEASRLKLETVRLYLGKIVITGTLVLSYFEIMDFQPFGFSSGAIIRDSSFRCPEDQIGRLLFQLCLSEFVMSKLIALAKVVGARVLFKLGRSASSKEKFIVSEEVIGLLYWQTILWISLPYLPYVAPISVLLMYLSFKFNKLVLVRFLARPAVAASADEARAYFLFFFNLTFTLSVLCMVLFFQHTKCYLKDCGSETCSSTEQATFSEIAATLAACASNCFGPYGKTSPSSSIISSLEDDSVGSSLYSLLSNAWVPWIIVAVLLFRLWVTRRVLSAVRIVSYDRMVSMTREMSALQRQVIKRDRTIKSLKDSLARERAYNQ